MRAGREGEEKKWKERRVEKRFHFLLLLNESNIITEKQDKEKKRIFWNEM